MNESKNARYHRLKRRVSVLSSAATAALLFGLLWSGGSRVLADLAGSGVRPEPIVVAAYVLVLAAASELVLLPLAFYGSWVLDRRYELSVSSVRVWFLDHLKAFSITTVMCLLAAEAVYALIRWDARSWWLPAALLATAAAALMTHLAPVLLLPVFYRFTPLRREALAQRLLALSRTAGVRLLGVYEWGLGERTRRANAALVGAGRTRRILLSDTLLAGYNDDEIEVILAHELAHHVHGDLGRALALEAVLLTAACATAAWALQTWWAPLGLSGPSDVAGLPLLLLAAGAVAVVSTPFVNAFSRRRERRADAFALSLTGRPDAFVSAMRRLAAQNLAEDSPSRTVVSLFHSHPPLHERIAAAGGHHLPDLNAGKAR